VAGAGDGSAGAGGGPVPNVLKNPLSLTSFALKELLGGESRLAIFYVILSGARICFYLSS